MTQDFAQGFVDLRRQALASQPLTELRLDHMEYGFDLGSFVVVR